MARSGLEKSCAQQYERSLNEAEEQIGLVVEIHVDERPREACAAGNLVHGHCFETDFGRHLLGGIEDFVAAALFLLVAALGDFAHVPTLWTV